MFGLVPGFSLGYEIFTEFLLFGVHGIPDGLGIVAVVFSFLIGMLLWLIFSFYGINI
jgi:hypothetical protein